MIKRDSGLTWTDGEEVECFLMALDELRKGLENYHIGWFFFDNCNVIKGFGHKQSKHMAKFVKSAHLHLKNNTEGPNAQIVWKKYFFP